MKHVAAAWLVNRGYTGVTQGIYRFSDPVYPLDNSCLFPFEPPGSRHAEEGRRIGAAEVRVVIANPAEFILEEGATSVKTDGVTWWYAVQRDLAPGQLRWITVTAFDQLGHRTVKTVRHVSGQ